MSNGKYSKMAENLEKRRLIGDGCGQERLDQIDLRDDVKALNFRHIVIAVTGVVCVIAFINNRQQRDQRVMQSIIDGESDYGYYNAIGRDGKRPSDAQQQEWRDRNSSDNSIIEYHEDFPDTHEETHIFPQGDAIEVRELPDEIVEGQEYIIHFD